MKSKLCIGWMIILTTSSEDYEEAITLLFEPETTIILIGYLILLVKLLYLHRLMLRG